MQQRTCETMTRPEPDFPRRIEAPCSLKQGSSGGPFFREYDSATGVGTISGVLSEAGRGSDNVVTSSYFGTWVQLMYNQIANRN
jgi:hypothetical protein